MANFMIPSVVNYACTCGIFNPLLKLYFCRHCLQIRCGFCVCHEVDSHFCSNCLENIPSSEARHKKNRCNNCCECPACGHTLSARATTAVPLKKQDEVSKESEGEKKLKECDSDKVVPKKMYYLACLACRWTSRDVGIPDRTVATGTWPDSEYANQTRFNLLLEYYQAIVLQEKQEKQEYWRRKTPKVHKFPSLTDRTGLTVSMIRRQIGWADKNSPKIKPVSIQPSVASEEVEDDLPEDIFTKFINLKNITTIEQRHCQPADQPITVNNLYPQRKGLWIKRSLRCRQCEHNVIKPEYHPSSIKYRIQLFASYHVPDVRLVSCASALKSGILNTAILKLSNPTMYDMTITIMELPTEEVESEMINDLKKGFEKQVSVSSNPASLTLSRQVSLNEEPRLVKQITTGKIELLDSSFVLNHRDDSAEFDEDVQEQKEEPKFIVNRRSNKVSIKIDFTPNFDLQANDEVIIGFTIQYTYVNTVSNASDKKDPQQHALTSRVYTKLGKIKS